MTRCSLLIRRRCESVTHAARSAWLIRTADLDI
jgi:hypothetical protein